MSNEAINWAYKQPVDSAAKFLLVTLADYADEAWSCYPSQDKLAEKTSMHRSSVTRHLKSLEDAGLIRRVHRQGAGGHRTSDRYVLNRASNVADSNVADSNVADSNVARHAGPMSHPATSQRRNLTHKPSVEPSLQPSLVRPAPADDSFDAFWAAYPRKDDKGRARKAWATALKKTAPETIIEGARRYASTPDLLRDGARFVKLPASWLNAEAWANEGTTLPPTQDEKAPFSLWDYKPYRDGDHA